jgi:hypothetical protein
VDNQQVRVDELDGRYSRRPSNNSPSVGSLLPMGRPLHSLSLSHYPFLLSFFFFFFFFFFFLFLFTLRPPTPPPPSRRSLLFCPFLVFYERATINPRQPRSVKGNFSAAFIAPSISEVTTFYTCCPCREGERDILDNTGTKITRRAHLTV